MTEITVPFNDRFQDVTLTAGQTVVDTDFPVIDDADLELIRVRASVETTFVLDTDYSLADVGVLGYKRITLAVAAQADDQLVIRGSRSPARTSNLLSGELRSAVLNGEFRSMIIAIQEMAREVSYALRLAPTDNPGGQDIVMPLLADRKGKYLYFNDTTGTPEAAAGTGEAPQILTLDAVPTSGDGNDGDVAIVLNGALAEDGNVYTKAAGSWSLDGSLLGPAGADGADGADGGVTDHGALTGLSDDDHSQYHNDTRGDARYVKTGETPHVLLDQGTISAESETVIALPSGYDGIEIEIIDWTPSVSSQMWLQFSTDGGSTWYTTNYHWVWRYAQTDNTVDSANATGGSYVQITGTQANTDGLNAILKFPQYAVDGPKRVRYDAIYGSSHPFTLIDGIGVCDATAIKTAAITHVKLYPGTGSSPTASFKYQVRGWSSAGATPAVFPKLQQVAGTLRNTGSGWFVLSDTDHEPIGVASVSNDTSKITVTLDFTASKVISFVATPDETYAGASIGSIGSSVGLTSIDIYLKDASGSAVDPSTLTNASGNIWFYGVFYR